MSRLESFHVLIIDDDEVDILTMQRALAKVMPTTSVTSAPSGAEGLALLRSGSIPRPTIVLADIRMPEMDGHEFLDVIRRDDSLRDSVVFFVTSSRAETDVRRASRQRVAGYIVKNAEGADFSELVNVLQQFASCSKLRS